MERKAELFTRKGMEEFSGLSAPLGAVLHCNVQKREKPLELFSCNQVSEFLSRILHFSALSFFGLVSKKPEPKAYALKKRLLNIQNRWSGMDNRKG